MNCILFDGDNWTNLLPLSYTRPVSEMRVGIITIAQKWQRYFNEPVSYKTQEYLSVKYPAVYSSQNVFINGSVLPSDLLWQDIQSLTTGQMLKAGNVVVAAMADLSMANVFDPENIQDFQPVETTTPIEKISYPWDIFSLNHKALEDDFRWITRGRESAPLSSSNRVSYPENIFIEEGATIEHSILNAQKGPIYIGKDAEIMEGCLIRGPLALCDHALLKMGTKIYGATTLGPHCKVGGEVNNSVFFGYSNKAHDGFLGNSVLGEWCNLGADTNNSNLKNNYVQVKVWNFGKERFINSGLQFCGLIMGDHSKSGINTMFNTGTVVGVSSNIFGAGFPRNIVPSFAWGGPAGYITFTTKNAFEVAREVMKRRNLEFTEMDEDILRKVFELTEKYRRF